MKQQRVLFVLLASVCVLLMACSARDKPRPSVENSAYFYPFDEPPIVTEFVTPDYPDEARSRGLEGTVRIKVLVGLDGVVEEAIVHGSTHPMFDAPALAAAQSFRFKPAMYKGAVTKSYVVVPVYFQFDARNSEEE